jgi:cytochrome c553
MSFAASRALLIMAGWLLLASAGLTVAHADDISDKAQICAACHGAAGVPISPEIPVIWGQNEGYLYLQLRDMKRGTRKVEQMAPIVQGLERPDMLALAAYFAAKPWPNLQQPSASDADAKQAVQTNASIVCTSCHLSGYLAAGAGTVPRLAGQEHAYLAKTMTDFRTGARGNNPGMTDLMKAASVPNLTAMAAYLAGL